MWAPLLPAAHPSRVGTGHKVNQREPSVYDLGEKATPGSPATGAATLTNIWHPSEARLEAKGLEENGFLLGPGSIPGWCGKDG